MATTPDVERWRDLRTLFRDNSRPAAADDQVKYDRFDWKLDVLGGTGCKFTYEDDQVRIEKTVKAGERPFELDVQTALTNLSDAPKKHAMSIAVFAYRTNEEVKGKLGRVSPFQTELECARAGDVKRLGKDASEFKSGWYSEPLVDRYAAIANYYFAEALVPQDVDAAQGEGKPSCDLLAEQNFRDSQKPADDNLAGDVYVARLAYPPRVLGPKDTATYREIAFFGPKERDVLGMAAGGKPHLQDLINLGTFSIVAKVLVQIITWIHGHITFGNWGIAIIVLTLGLRTALFPLTWKQIKSAIAMRKLKPEIDALNAKFKDDPQAKNLAMMELWRKHKVNPLGGCLPALVQMPIWFAMYATLQTAVEFYHTKFLVVHGPLGARSVLRAAHRARRSHDRAAAHHPAAGHGPDAAEADELADAGRLHGDDAVPAGGARRLHAHQQRARHHAAGGDAAALPEHRRASAGRGRQAGRGHRRQGRQEGRQDEQ